MIILHGDNQVASRQHLTTLKQAATKLGKQITELAGEVSLELLMPAAESNSLFGSSNLVVIENLFLRYFIKFFSHPNPNRANNPKKYSKRMLCYINIHVPF